MAPPCDLGFLTTWRLDPRGEHLDGEVGGDQRADVLSLMTWPQNSLCISSATFYSLEVSLEGWSL